MRELGWRSGESCGAGLKAERAHLRFESAWHWYRSGLNSGTTRAKPCESAPNLDPSISP